MVSRRGAETKRLRVKIEKASFAPRLCVQEKALMPRRRGREETEKLLVSVLLCAKKDVHALIWSRGAREDVSSYSASLREKIVEAFLVQSLSVPLGKLLEPRAALLEELGELLYGL